MNFKYKCWLQKIFSILPRGEHLNYLVQRYVVHSMPVTDDIFLGKVRCAISHHAYFKQHHQIENLDNRYYEFGAGTNMIIPLTIAHLGYKVQAIDLRPLLKKNMVKDSIQKFNNLQDKLSFNIISPQFDGQLDTLKRVFNLYYSAPIDARYTPFPDEYFDFTSSTSVLEHVPASDILAMLKETYRILKKGGICSLIIDYRDHWSFSDDRLSIYHFLKYSERDWKKYNPDLHYQNRLRHKDYIALIEQTDFTIIVEKTQPPSINDQTALANLSIDKYYHSYTSKELSIKTSHIVLRK